MNDLQPGILALVIGCIENSSNVGKIVTLKQLVKAGEVCEIGKVKREVWVIAGTDLKYRSDRKGLVSGDISIAQSKHLLPIRPEADPLHEKQQQELHA